MNQPDLTDLIAEFAPVLLGSFIAPLAVLGLGATAYHLVQKYELPDKSKIFYSQAKDQITQMLEKYHS